MFESEQKILMSTFAYSSFSTSSSQLVTGMIAAALSFLFALLLQLYISEPALPCHGEVSIAWQHQSRHSNTGRQCLRIVGVCLLLHELSVVSTLGNYSSFATELTLPISGYC